jgi:hypothetical protein
MHRNLTPETHHLMNAAAFAKMKPGAVLVNAGMAAANLLAGIRGERLPTPVNPEVYERAASR